MTQEFVTLPREVLEQVLEALIYCEAPDSSSEEQRFQAAIALRAALEQPQVVEVVVTTNQQGQCVAVTRQDDEGQILSVIWQAKQPQVEQEPVAWLHADGKHQPLYTHPQPKREPPTHEEIDNLCPQYDDPMRREMWIIGFKAAHNIK